MGGLNADNPVGRLAAAAGLPATTESLLQFRIVENLAQAVAQHKRELTSNGSFSCCAGRIM